MSRRDNNKSKINTKKVSSKQLSNEVLKYLSMRSNKKFSAKQIISKLKYVNSKETLFFVLDKLKAKKLIIEKDGFYTWNSDNVDLKFEKKDKKSSNAKILTGRVDMIRSGSAYIVVSGEEEDIYVPGRHLNGAMNRDLVTIEVPFNSRRRKPEGKVLKIEKRSLTHVIGQLEANKNYGKVVPILENNTPEVFVNLKDFGKAKNKDFVVVEIE